MADPEIPVTGMESLDQVSVYSSQYINIAPAAEQAAAVNQATVMDTTQGMAETASVEHQPEPAQSARPTLPPEEEQVGSVSVRTGAVLDAEPEHMEEDLDMSASRPVRIKPKMTSLRLQTRGGRMRADQDRIKTILKEAIVNLCNSGLYYQTEMRIEGVLGITLDRREVILINVHDIIRTSESEDDFPSKLPYTPTVHKRKNSRPWRVTARNYIKRGQRRSVTNHLAEALLKKQRKNKECVDDDDGGTDMDIFTNTSFDQNQAQQGSEANSANENNGDNPEGSLGNLAQAVAWYAAVDDETHIEDGPMLNEHGLPLPDPLTSPDKADMIRLINEEVGRGFVKKQEKKKRRGEYNNYTAEMRAKIGQYAVEQGIGKAMKHFKSLFGRPISESTVRCMRKAYLDAKRDTQADEVVVLPKKDRGRPLMLKEYDGEVMEYIENLRRNGAQINVQIVMDAARGVLLHKDKARLKEFGGSIEITKAWAQSFMARKGLHGMGRRRRKSEGQKSPVKKKNDKLDPVTSDQVVHHQPVQQQQQQPLPLPMQPQHIPHQQQQGPTHQQQPPQHNQQQNLSQHPTPVHTPHSQEHETHLHNLDVCTPPPAHEQRNNTMVFPERQMHNDPMHDHRNAMVYDRPPHHPDHTSMHDPTARMVFPERHPMAATTMQDTHHMFFPDRLNLNPVPPAHCTLWPSQNIHHKNN